MRPITCSFRSFRSLKGGAPWVRKFGNHITVHRPRDRPTAPQAYQCKITQPTGMATQMQLEVILAGNRIATRVL